MYTRGAADASEHMLSAKIKLWKGPANSMLLCWASKRQPHGFSSSPQDSLGMLRYTRVLECLAALC